MPRGSAAQRIRNPLDVRRERTNRHGIFQLMTARFLLIVLATAAALAAQDIPQVRDIEVTLTEGTSMAATPSPDRRWIAIDLLGGVWILPMRGGEARRLT